jgi:hypothetical protein
VKADDAERETCASAGECSAANGDIARPTRLVLIDMRGDRAGERSVVETPNERRNNVNHWSQEDGLGKSTGQCILRGSNTSERLFQRENRRRSAQSRRTSNADGSNTCSDWMNGRMSLDSNPGRDWSSMNLKSTEKGLYSAVGGLREQTILRYESFRSVELLIQYA